METVRSYWVDTMLKIAGPVIFALEKDSLQKQMPVECRQEDVGTHALRHCVVACVQRADGR